MNIRKLLETFTHGADWNHPELRAQADKIDLYALEPVIESMVTHALILSHAFDVMKDGRHKHPIDAFMHSVSCQGPVTDDDFSQLLQVWAMLCGRDVFAQQDAFEQAAAARQEQEDQEWIRRAMRNGL
jgi:hypothetical protein